MICQRCGAMMRLLNRSRSRVKVYWCSACQRFQETRAGA
jgi:transposase